MYNLIILKYVNVDIHLSNMIIYICRNLGNRWCRLDESSRGWPRRGSYHSEIDFGVVNGPSLASRLPARSPLPQQHRFWRGKGPPTAW